MRKIALNNILSSSDLIGVSHITLKDPSGKPKDDNKGDDDRKERGNVFFYILLAVALFAALSYAVSRNNTGSTNIFDEEQAKLAAQEIIEYGNTVANAVQKLRLRGCSDTEISFENDLSSIDYSNTGSPTDESCHIFKSNGGNIAYMSPPEISQTYEDSEGIFFQNLYNQYRFTGNGAIENVGTDAAELIMFNRMRESYPNAILICDYINNIVGDQIPVFAGKTAACFEEGHGGSQVSYYQVLIAR